MSKRILSLVLAMVMVLGTFGTVFAANTVTTEAEAGAFLKAAGVLNGDENGNLNLGNNLSRQDAVILVAQLRGEIEAAKNFSKLPTYEDVKIKFYNAPLAWAQDNGLFVGHSDKVFGFGENLTAQQYSRVLFEALGYKVDTTDASDIKYSVVFDKANEEGILKGLELTQTTEITRGQMALMTFNALGVTMKDSKKTLAETLNIEMPEAPAAKELTAEVNDTENLKEVVLELSNAKLVDKDKLENTNNYKVADNTVVKAEVVDNNVIILLENALRDGREYKLRVRSIERAINKEYTFKAKDNTIPSIEEVVALGEYGIKIVASEPINVYDTNRGRNFEVDGKNIAMNVESYGRNIILTPYTNESFKDAKELTVTALADFAGFKSATQKFDLEVTKDDVKPEVTDVILRGYDKVEVVFNKDVYKSSVKHYANRNNVGNISYEAGRQNVYADKSEKIDTNRVLYTFNDEVYNEVLRKDRTRFTVEGVQNHSKVTMDRVTNLVAREVLDNIEPEIMKHELTVLNASNGKATMKIFFDKDVEGIFKGTLKNEFEAKDHFRLFEREVLSRTEVKDKVTSVKYDVDSNGKDIKDVIVVTFEGLDKFESKSSDKWNELYYILEVQNFTDVSSKRNKMFREYIEFRQLDTEGTFQIKGDIEMVRNDSYETHIKIKFNDKVDRAIAEDRTNYIFTKNNGDRQDVIDLKGRIVTEKNGEEVVLILPDFKLSNYKELRVLDTLKNTDGDRLDGVYTFHLPSGVRTNNNDYSVSYLGGKYIVEAKSGVTAITLKTDVEGTFEIADVAGLKKVTIDAKNAHVIIPASLVLDEVAVKSIAKSSLEILGTVKKLVLETADTVRVYGEIKGMLITSTVDTAKVILSANGTETNEIKKDKAQVVNNDGKLNDAVLDEGAKAQLVAVENALNDTTTAGAITLKVEKEADKENVAKITELLVAALKVEEGYKLEIRDLSLKTKTAFFKVTETNNDKNTAEESLSIKNVVIEVKAAE